MKEAAAVIFGWRQPTLDADAAAFFRAANPWGFILFGGACQNREQVRALVDALHDAVGRQALVFIDQEGGRVARLKAPEWPTFPAASAYGALHRIDPDIGLEACRIGHRLIAHELREIGIRADCAPVLDLPAEGADPIIGDRAFSSDPAIVAALGKAALDGLAAGGVAGVVKHMPGHGRADADSHLALPRVAVGRQALDLDLAPFKALRDAPMAMTAHVLYDVWDQDRPATVSPIIIEQIIRNEIGFDGLLMTDDLGMKALKGEWWDKAEGSMLAGCDILLHCSGEIVEMERLAMAAPELAGKSLARAQRAEKVANANPEPFDVPEGWDVLSMLLRELKTE